METVYAILAILAAVGLGGGGVWLWLDSRANVERAKTELKRAKIRAETARMSIEARQEIEDASDAEVVRRYKELEDRWK